MCAGMHAGCVFEYSAVVQPSARTPESLHKEGPWTGALDALRGISQVGGAYDLEYEDGDSETRVPARLIRPLATAAPRDLIPTPLTTTSQAPPAVETGGEL